MPELGESLTWSQLDAWAVAVREDLPAAALAAALEELQDWLIDQVYTELVALLRGVARERLSHAQALAAYDAFCATVTTEGHLAAGEPLAGARDQVFTCLLPELRARLAHLGGPELGSGILERVMRELNARTVIGGSRWSVDGVRDLITVRLARMTDHPAWTTLRQSLRPPNAFTFNITTAKFNAA